MYLVDAAIQGKIKNLFFTMKITDATIKCKGPLYYADLWAEVEELTANLPPGSGDLLLYINLISSVILNNCRRF